MEAGITLLVIVAVVSGIAFGIYIGKTMLKQTETQGVIYVYASKTNEQPSLLLEYAVPIDDIMARKRVLFDVKIVR
jgi:hypothetical protein